MRMSKRKRTAGLYQSTSYHSADSNKSEIVVVFDTGHEESEGVALPVDLKEAMRLGWGFRHPTPIFRINRLSPLLFVLCVKARIQAIR
jgi:hypothetical protein